MTARRPQANKNAQEMALVAEREIKAVQLAIEGHSYAEIAKKLGFSNGAGAWKAVHRVLARQEAANADSLRTLRGAQLERLLSVAMPKAAKGDWAAYDRALRTLDRLIRLEGLDLPVQVQVSATPEHEISDPQGRLALVAELRAQADSRVIEGETA